MIAGQDEVIEEVLIAVLCQGHALLEGVPGIAKTLIVKALGRLLGLGFQRVQATPDLMPADILGTTILRPGSDRLHLSRRAGLYRSAAGGRDQPHAAAHPGRAAGMHGRAAGDQRRRAPPAARVVHRLRHRRTRSISRAPTRLPEAQLDRFLLKIRVAYPCEAEELADSGAAPRRLGRRAAGRCKIAPIPEDLLAAARAEVRAIRIEPELYDYILALARRTREWPTLLLGASPRAALSVMRVAQAAAAFDGRDYLVPDDVKRAVQPVLRHRVMLKPEAELEGFDADRVLADVIAAVPVPRQ